MTQRYAYVGPAELARLASSNSPRVHVRAAVDADAFAIASPHLDDGSLIATFVVLDEIRHRWCRFAVR